MESLQGKLGELAIMTAVNCHRVTSGDTFEWFTQRTSPKIEASFLPPINAPSLLNPAFKADKTLLNSSKRHQQYSLWQRAFSRWQRVLQRAPSLYDLKRRLWSQRHKFRVLLLLLRYLSLFLTTFMWCITQVMSENVSVRESTLMHVG